MKTTTEQTKEPITNVSDGILSDEEAGRKMDIDLYPNNEAGAFDYMDEESLLPASETVEEAAKKYLKKIDEESGTMWTEDDDEIVKHFVLFHKQQSDTIINSLTDKLDNSEANVHMYKTVSDEYFDKFCKGEDIIKELVEALELANGTLGSCTIMRKGLSQFLNIENIQKDKLYISNIIEKANEYLQGKS